MLTNDARWSNGQLPPLKGHAQLETSALGHSTRMATNNFFMHCDPDTQSQPWDRMSAAGYAWNNAGENIATGQTTPAGVVNTWMNSSGHRANILSATYHELGVGYFFQSDDSGGKRTSNANTCTVDASLTGNYRHYWTQNFGRRSNNYPLVIAREDYSTGTCAIDLYVYGTGFATQMRFSNDGGANWSSWQAFSADTTWTLQGASGGVATVHSEIRNGSGSVRSASDSIRLTANCGLPDPNRIHASGFE